MNLRLARGRGLALMAAMAAGLPIAAAKAQTAGGETRQFRDWSAACRADRYCVAETADKSSGGGSPPANLLRLARHAAQPSWEISIRANTKLPDLRAEPYLWVDDDNEVLEADRDIGAYGAAEDVYLIGEAAQRALERFGPGRTVRFEFTDIEGGGHAATFSLSGLNAALLWIDERQRRVGAPRTAGRPPLGLERMPD